MRKAREIADSPASTQKMSQTLQRILGCHEQFVPLRPNGFCGIILQSSYVCEGDFSCQGWSFLRGAPQWVGVEGRDRRRLVLEQIAQTCIMRCCFATWTGIPQREEWRMKNEEWRMFVCTNMSLPMQCLVVPHNIVLESHVWIIKCNEHCRYINYTRANCRIFFNMDGSMTKLRSETVSHVHKWR